MMDALALLGLALALLIGVGVWLYYPPPKAIDIDTHHGHLPDGAVRPIYGRVEVFDWQASVPELSEERLADVVALVTVPA